MMQSPKYQPKFELKDETGTALRRFYSMEMAQKFLCEGYTITKLNLPKPPSDYEIALSTLGEALF